MKFEIIIWTKNHIGKFSVKAKSKKRAIRKLLKEENLKNQNCEFYFRVKSNQKIQGPGLDKKNYLPKIDK